jgi:hypothetical protein
MEFSVVTSEGATLPDPEQLSGKEAIEITVGGQLVVLTSGDQQN